jgi:hypothetical protein
MEFVVQKVALRQVSLVFSSFLCKYHSTNDPFSSLFTRCSYQKENGGKLEASKRSGQTYDMIYLTAIGLTPGGSSTVHIYTQTIHRMTENKKIHRKYKNILNSAGRAPSLRVIPWNLPYNCGKNAEKPVRAAEECQLA